MLYVQVFLAESMKQSEFIRHLQLKRNDCKDGFFEQKANRVKRSQMDWSAKCKCGASEQTADHIILRCTTHRALRGIMGLTVLDDETMC